MPHQPTTWAHVSGYRFLLRRIERALLSGDTGASSEPLRARAAPLTIGCVLAAVVVAAGVFFGLLRPQARLDRAQIVMGRDSGALYVRVGDTWHPVLNLASARLIAATDANPQPVSESELRHTKRGPLLGIPGAPQLLGAPLSGDDAVWTICDTDGATPTTVVVGPTPGLSVHRLARDQAVLVTPGTGPPSYLLYNGQRAVVDLADTAVVRALRLEGHAPVVVSQSLLNVVPEGPPITAPRIPGAGGKAAGLPDFPVGSVLRITRGDGDEYYAVLSTGVQRVGQVAADLLRFSDSRGTATMIAVPPDAIRGAQIVNTLPVGTFPERAPTDGGQGGAATTVCATSGAALLTANGLPLPVGQAPVALSQADGRGPALDGVYLPPGRSAYVRGSGGDGTRYLVTDTGVRFAIHDNDAAHDLGLHTDPIPVPWPMLAALPSGPELSRAKASVARDVVAGAP
ncbi:type VII secretion protein EccB [Mycobacterium sp. Aquia_216]|uniref:type VII secretion protein EccB n=1 Tax=Mycobacterium sp. Aquia_216 TaxID=2991729 RepID=UPI00227BBB95|nr:type VII secretion protein EccB [Mycobacterium sp. Aquia_216]WAJ46198.1 type VII secretion protein EccB [Mycobacterium sp. Aquia_216]